MHQSEPKGTCFVPANVDDGDQGDIVFLKAGSDACPVRNWLAGFAPGGTMEAALAGLEDGSLEPVLAEGVVRAALAGRGIAITPRELRTWGHLDAVLTTPDPRVFVSVCLRDDPGVRFKLGLRLPVPEEGPPPSEMTPEARGQRTTEVATAVRVAMAALRAGLVEVPDLPPTPARRPFRADEGRRSFAQLAARKGIAVDPAGAAAVDALQEAANVASEAMRAERNAGTLDSETAWERSQIAQREWLLEAYRLVGGEAVTAVLGDRAVPKELPPELPGWPYWLRKTVARGRDTGRKDIAEMMEAIFYLCRNDGLAALDAAYRRIDVSAMSESALIALLRTPFTSRDGLEAWTDFRERVRSEMYVRDFDGDKLLMGLGKASDPEEGGTGPVGPH